MTTASIYGLYLITGCATGILSGLFGIGGGVILVPVLYYVFLHHLPSASIAIHMASGTSLAVIALTSSLSAWSHHRKIAIQWELYRRLLPGIITGVIIGVKTADLLHSSILQIIFGLFVLTVGGHLLFSSSKDAKTTLPGRWPLFGLSNVIGFKSGLLGIGGGTVTIPLLLHCRVALRQAVAISALCSVTLATIGACTAMVTGSDENIPLAHHIGYVYWPAVLCVGFASMISVHVGAWLSPRIAKSY